MKFFASSLIFATISAIQLEATWDVNRDGVMSRWETGRMLRTIQRDQGGVDHKEVQKDLNALYNPDAPWRGYAEWHTDAISEVYEDEETGELTADGIAEVIEATIGVAVTDDLALEVLTLFDTNSSGGLDQSE